MRKPDKLDLLLVNPSGRRASYQALGGSLTAIEPPLWCRLIAGYARRRGYSVRIIDAEARGWAPETVAREVAGLSPRLVGMVVFGHQPSASTQQMVSAGAACTAIKKADPDLPIVIVGGHVAALPERTLLEEDVDFACNGEGPVTIVQLLDALNGGKPHDLSGVEGLVFRHQGGARNNPRAPLIQDLDADLDGDAWDLLPMERYRAHNWHCFGALEERQPYASIHTSLGCPYRCTFCCINAPFATNLYRMRSPESVVAEIGRLHDEYGIKTLKIVDEMFVLNRRHVTAICDLLIEADYDLNIWAYARVDTVKADMLERLRSAGFRWLALGIESGSAHVRDGANKSFGRGDIVSIVRQIQQAGINVIGNFIFGLPDDTRESMQRTLDLAIELKCEFANFYSAMAYPGSALYSAAIETGQPLPRQWSGYSQHSYDATPLATETLTSAEVLRFRDHAFQVYFSGEDYLEGVARKFGAGTRRHIEEMTRLELPRMLYDGRMDDEPRDRSRRPAA